MLTDILHALASCVAFVWAARWLLLGVYALVVTALWLAERGEHARTSKARDTAVEQRRAARSDITRAQQAYADLEARCNAALGRIDQLESEVLTDARIPGYLADRIGGSL